MSSEESVKEGGVAAGAGNVPEGGGGEGLGFKVPSLPSSPAGQSFLVQYVTTSTKYLLALFLSILKELKVVVNFTSARPSFNCWVN